MQECYIYIWIEAAIEQTSIKITTAARKFWYFCHSEFKISSDIKIHILLAFKSRVFPRDSLEVTRETISFMEVYDCD